MAIDTAYLDAETVSQVDMKQVGARTYAEDPSTWVLCWSWALDDGPVQIWWPGDPQPVQLIEAISAGCRVMAHNFQFDATIWDRHMVPLGWPAIPVERWSCTSFRCSLARLPAGLEEAAKALDLAPKNLAGRKLVLSLTKRDLAANPLTDEEREQVAAYCKQDTQLCRLIDRRLPEIPDAWRDVFGLCHVLNERGWPVDMDAVNRLIAVRDAENIRLNAEFVALTEGELASAYQVKRLKAKLSGLGVPLPDLQRETLEEWVEQNPKRHDLAAQLIHNRLESSHASDAKLDRIVAVAGGTGRVRDGFTLHGAHTGRWSGKGVQLRNLKRVDVERPEDLLQRLLDRADGIAAGTVDPMRVDGRTMSIKSAIANCLRALFMAPDGWMYVSADLSQIEARVLAWISGQEDKLAAYRAGRDVYKLEANNLNSNSRHLGK